MYHCMSQACADCFTNKNTQNGSKYHQFGTPLPPNGAINYLYLLFYSAIIYYLAFGVD